MMILLTKSYLQLNIVKNASKVNYTPHPFGNFKNVDTVPVGNRYIPKKSSVLDPHLGRIRIQLFYPNMDPDPGSRTNADQCRSGSWSGLKVTKS